MKKKWMLLIGLILLLSNKSAMAWQDIAEEKKAVVAFEFDMDRIKSGEVMSMLGFDRVMGPATMQMGNEGEYVMSAKHVSGFASLPASADEFEMAPGADLPFNFLIRLAFEDDSAKSIYEEAAKKGTEETVDGRKLLMPTDEDAPKNVRLRLVDDNTLEMGTIGYLTVGNADLKSKTLAGLWKSQSNSPMRIVADLSKNKALMEEVVEKFGDGVPPPVVAYFNLLDKISSLSFAMDLDGSNLIELNISGHESDDATAIETAINSLLEMGQFGFMQAGAQIQQETPVMHKALKKIVDGFKTDVDGKSVMFKIEKPEEFNDGISEIVKSMGGQ